MRGAHNRVRARLDEPNVGRPGRRDDAVDEPLNRGPVRAARAVRSADQRRPARPGKGTEVIDARHVVVGAQRGAERGLENELVARAFGQPDFIIGAACGVQHDGVGVGGKPCVGGVGRRRVCGARVVGVDQSARQRVAAVVEELITRARKRGEIDRHKITR